MKFHAITENHLYAKTYAKGQKSVGKYFVVYCLKDLKAKQISAARPDKKRINRVGLTVTKKIGGAVQRNRCKRLLREAYRLTLKKRGANGGKLVVIVAREALLRAKTPQLLPEMERAFSVLSL